MNVLTLLPLLEGWSYKVKNIDVPLSINAGEEKTMETALRSGWFISGMASFDNPNTEFVIEYYDTFNVKRSIIMKPSTLYELGLVAPNATGFFCPKYSSEPPPMYVVAYFPTSPLSFKRENKLLIRAPKDSSVTIYKYSHTFILIENEQLFIEGLNRLYSEKIIEIGWQILKELESLIELERERLEKERLERERLERERLERERLERERVELIIPDDCS